MPTTTTLLQFALASLLLAVTPGPSVVLLLAVGSERGRAASTATAFGLALGTFIWVAVTAAGLGAVFATRPDLLDLVTATGGAYLLFLAARTVRSVRTGDLQTTAPDTPVAVRRSPLVDGIVVNLLNPSLTLFLAALLPPFLDADRGPAWVQVLVLGGLLTAISTVVNVSVGLAGSAAGGRLRRWVGGRTVAVGAAVVYGLLGILAVASAVL